MITAAVWLLALVYKGTAATRESRLLQEIMVIAAAICLTVAINR